MCIKTFTKQDLDILRDYLNGDKEFVETDKVLRLFSENYFRINLRSVIAKKSE